MSEFCIICAAQRTGTTFLGEAVSNAYEAAWPQEIFNEAYAKPSSTTDYDYKTASRLVRGNFFRFREDVFREDPELSYPSLENRRLIFGRYLQQLRDTFPNDRFLIDIKYTSWHHLDGYWRDPSQRPGLIQLVRDHSIPIIHLVRENLFAQYCSVRLAEKSGVWWTTDGAVSAEHLTIDVHDCERWMSAMSNLQIKFNSWFEGHPLHGLSYERLLDGKRFAPSVEKTFTEVFGGPPAGELSTTYTKTVPALADVVENIQPVINHFRGTRFADDVLASLTRSL